MRQTEKQQTIKKLKTDEIPRFGAITSKAVEIAKEAGAAILEIYSTLATMNPRTSGVLVAEKADHSPVTLADLAAHRIIKDRLSKLTPDIPVISEEDDVAWTESTKTKLFWLVDPLDGTKEFLSGTDEFTVNIALISDGEPVFGVVAIPAMNAIYWGDVDTGAFREINGRLDLIEVADTKQGEILRVVVSKTHLDNETREYMRQMGPREVILAGSSLKFCRVAEGAADIYPRLGPTCEWDTAAAHAIVCAAGGHVCGLDGLPIRYGKADPINPSFIASSLPIKAIAPCAA
jgi:3'(2'), 5'-bisphosphate nucleotidase